jgi:predicted nucleic acid-binding protein
MLTAALQNVASLLALPHARMLSEEDGFVEVFRQVIAGLVVRGNTVPDAHIAAILRQHGVRVLYTADADFRRFDLLDVRNPLAE